MRLQRLFTVLLVAACGCGSSTQTASPETGSKAATGAETLDCAWLARNNCWEDALRELASCVPAFPAVGRLSSAGACVFGSGEIITSRTAFFDGTATFVGGRGQRACGMVEVAGDEWSLGTISGTTSVSMRNGGVRVTCPDGRVALTDDAAASLRDCGSAIPRFKLSSIEGKLTIGADDNDATHWLCE